jgi:hypothetical protein
MPAGPSLGEYAALIPILGTGMRGERRLRLQFTVAYGPSWRSGRGPSPDP